MTEKKRTEIDLIEILIKLYLYTLKYKWFFVIAIIISIAYSFITISIQEESFESSMVIKTDLEKDYMYAVTFQEFQNRFEQNPGELIIKVMNSADNLINNDNIDELAKRTEINSNILESLNSIKTEYKYTKGEAVSNYVTISVSASDTKIYNTLGEGIISFINSNSSILAKHQRDSVFLTEVIIKLDKKISELDSLQNKFLKTGKFNDLIIYKENSFFSENIMLTSLREQLSLDLKEINQVEIIEDFYIPKTNPKNLKKVLTSNVIIFLFISIILVFFLILNQKANDYKKRIMK